MSIQTNNRKRLLGVTADNVIQEAIKMQEQTPRMNLRQNRLPLASSIVDAIRTQRLEARNFLVSQLIDSENFEFWMNEIDAFIFADEGVLFQGEDVIPGSPALVDFLVKNKKKVIIMTNNDIDSRATYAKKLEKLGYKIDKNWVVNPPAILANYFAIPDFGNGRKSVYLIGSKGINEELEESGIDCFEDWNSTSDGSTWLPKPKEEVGAVVVGRDPHFDYKKLMIASNYLMNPVCHFFATNEDEIYPETSTDPTAVAAVKCATNRQPIYVGKPNSPPFLYIHGKWRIDPKRTIMVGDRTDIDVKFGRDHGLKTMLVLSGCHKVSDMIKNQLDARFDMIPHFYAKSLGDLVPKKDANDKNIRK